MNAWSRAVAFFDERESGEALAATRILSGIVLALTTAQMLDTDAFRVLWVDMSAGGLRDVECGPLAYFGCSVPVVRSVLVTTIVVAILFSAGVFTRVTGVLTYLLARWEVGLNWGYGGSSYYVLTNLLFLLVFSDAGGAWSIDALRRGGPRPVPAWPRRLAVWQLVVVYASTGMHKVGSGWVPWGPADSIWNVWQDPAWHRVPMGWAWPLYRLTQLGSVGTWFFENGAPILLLALWFRRTKERPGRLRAFFNRWRVRDVYLVSGVLLHAGIALFMEVGPFGAAMMCLYCCCLDGGEWRAALAWLRRRLRPGTQDVAAPFPTG